MVSGKQQATRHQNLSIGVLHCGLLVVRHGYLVLGVQVNKGSVWSLDWWESGRTHFFLQPLILRTKESWFQGDMDIGSGLNCNLVLVWTDIGSSDGRKSGPGSGCWVSWRTWSLVSGQFSLVILSGVWMSLRSTQSVNFEEEKTSQSPRGGSRNAEVWPQT